jgi:hypothetical protein
MAIKSELVSASIESLLTSTGVLPGVWSEDQVKSLIYVVMPLAFPTAKARSGKNSSEVSLHFRGAFMSTRSAGKGRDGVSHTSSPFLQFMSELPRGEAESFEPKPGETQIYRLASVEEEVEDCKPVFTVQTKATRWRHKVTESEQSKTLTPGTRIPYNFRLELGVNELKGLIGAVTEYDEQWESCKETIPLKQPQLHLLLSLGAETHLKGAENKEVYNMPGVVAYHVNLKSENVLACKWVMPADVLYDKSANLPDCPVDHNNEMEDIPTMVSSKPKTVAEVISLKDPFGTIRKLWIKKLNNASYTVDQLDDFLKSLTGDLEYFWTHLESGKKATCMTKLQEMKPKTEVTAKAHAVAKAAEQAAVSAASLPKEVENAKEEPTVSKPVTPPTPVKTTVSKPVTPPTPVKTTAPVGSGAFTGMADDDEFDLPTY